MSSMSIVTNESGHYMICFRLTWHILYAYKRVPWYTCVALRTNVIKPSSSETEGLLVGTMRYFRVRDIFGRKFTSRADQTLGTYSYRTSSRSVRIGSRWLQREVQSGDSVAFLHQEVFRIDCGSWAQGNNIRRSISTANLSKVYRKFISLMYAISTLLLVAREASRVHNLLYFSSIVERLLKLPQKFLRCANLSCTGHTTTSTERGDDRSAALYAPPCFRALLPIDVKGRQVANGYGASCSGQQRDFYVKTWWPNFRPALLNW